MNGIVWHNIIKTAALSLKTVIRRPIIIISMENQRRLRLTQRVLQKTRLRRSKLADLIYVLQTHFNNHYFTLTPRFSHQCAPPVFMLLT